MMNAGNANLLNAVTLIAMSIWGYKAGGSPTALIPLGFGAILLYFTNSIRNHNKTVAHIAVVLTLLALIALIAKPLPAAIERGGGPGLYRIIAMVVTGVISMIAFVMSFIAAKKARQGREGREGRE